VLTATVIWLTVTSHCNSSRLIGWANHSHSCAYNTHCMRPSPEANIRAQHSTISSPKSC
jgi:hypothetical protein